MNYDKLVDVIVEEIYSKLKNSSHSSMIQSKKKAVILWSNSIEEFKDLENEYELILYDENVRDCDILIVSKLCLRGITNLALGASVSGEERFILKMLMKGKKVYLIESGIEYRRYKETAPKALYNKYIEAEETIESFGVEIIEEIKKIASSSTISLSKEVEKLEKVQQVRIITTEDTIDFANKRLISESDLRKPKISGVKNLIISKKSIITPLASDFIRINKLIVKRV